MNLPTSPRDKFNALHILEVLDTSRTNISDRAKRDRDCVMAHYRLNLQNGMDATTATQKAQETWLATHLWAVREL
jgi:hypothetical protein